MSMESLLPPTTLTWDNKAWSQLLCPREMTAERLPTPPPTLTLNDGQRGRPDHFPLQNTAAEKPGSKQNDAEDQ